MVYEWSGWEWDFGVYQKGTGLVRNGVIELDSEQADRAIVKRASLSPAHIRLGFNLH